jgi:hypothetical protein
MSTRRVVSRVVAPLIASVVSLAVSVTARAQPVEAEASASAGSEGGAASSSSGGSAQGDGFFKARGYFHIAPGIMAVSLSRFAFPLYAWGLSGGYHLPVTDKFIIEVGGFFDHMVRATFGAGSVNFFGIGPELRMGGGAPKIFGYGLVRLGVGITHLRLRDPTPDPGEPALTTGTGAGFLMTLGGGIQGLVHPNVALGGEPAFDILAGNGGAVGFFRLRFFVAILF